MQSVMAVTVLTECRDKLVKRGGEPVKGLRAAKQNEYEEEPVA